jgi:hypothetical protein
MTPRYLWQRGDLHQVAMQMIAGLHAWRDYGRKVSGTLLAECLARASALGVSLTRAAQLLKNGPSDESIRKALHFQGFDLETLRAKISRSLRLSLPRALSRRPVTIAIDYHLRPYYGNVEATPSVRGGKAKEGTRWFWTYATAAIVSRGQRYTVALEPIFHREQTEVVLERLWQQMAQIPLKVERILLDREFCASDVILWLQHRRIPFIVPLVRRGRFGPTRNQDQGNAFLFRRGRKGLHAIAWQPRSSSRTRELIRVNAICVPNGRRRPLVFLVSHTNWSFDWIRRMYKTRFGIEASYRQLGQALALTTTRDPCWRLLLVAIALLLRNAWVQCQAAALKPDLVTFKTILNWLANAFHGRWTERIPGFFANRPPPCIPIRAA